MLKLKHSTVALAVAGAVALGALTGCSQDGGVDLTALPKDMSWSSYQGQPVPVSKEDGPKHTEGIPAWGYSPTPQGALLAAINDQVRIALAPDDVWAITVRGLTAPGRGRDEFATFRTMQSITGPIKSKDARKFLGFQIKNWKWDKDKEIPVSCAVILAQSQNGKLFSYPVAMAYLNGEWRVVLNESAEHIDASPLKNLDGFTKLPQPSGK